MQVVPYRHCHSNLGQFIINMVVFVRKGSSNTVTLTYSNNSWFQGLVDVAECHIIR